MNSWIAVEFVNNMFATSNSFLKKLVQPLHSFSRNWRTAYFMPELCDLVQQILFLQLFNYNNFISYIITVYMQFCLYSTYNNYVVCFYLFLIYHILTLGQKNSKDLSLFTFFFSAQTDKV